MEFLDVESKETLAQQNMRRTLTLAGVGILHRLVFVAVSRIPSPRSRDQPEFAGTFFFVEPRKRKEERPAIKSKDSIRAQPPAPEATRNIDPPEPDRSTAITLPSIDWS